MVKRSPYASYLIAGTLFIGCVKALNQVQIAPGCPSIPATSFARIGVDAKAGALKFGELVTAGDASIKIDPSIVSVVSQNVADDQITASLICAAKARGELTTPEQVEHAWKVARFYRLNPTPQEALEFHGQNPFPRSIEASKGPGLSQEAKDVLRERIRLGYELKENIERDYRAKRADGTFQSNAEALIKEWDRRAGSWGIDTQQALNSIDPIIKARFKAYVGSSMVHLGENSKWSAIDSWLNNKLDFLNKLLEDQ